jgi:hypothetical protein
MEESSGDQKEDPDLCTTVVQELVGQWSLVDNTRERRRYRGTDFIQETGWCPMKNQRLVR